MSRITQRGATGPLALHASGMFQQSTDASLLTLVGTKWDLADGREVVLVLAGASNLAPGKLMQDAPIIANHQGLTVTAVQAYSANGNTPATVTATLGGTAATASQYANGFLYVASGTGAGQTVQVSSNTAQASTTGSVVITIENPNTALDTTSVIGLIPAQGNGVVVNPVTATGALRGASFYPITAANYGFLTSRGEVAVLSDGAIGIGLGASPSGSVAGAVAVAAATTARVGRATQAGVDTTYHIVSVDIA